MRDSFEVTCFLQYAQLRCHYCKSQTTLKESILITIEITSDTLCYSASAADTAATRCCR